MAGRSLAGTRRFGPASGPCNLLGDRTVTLVERRHVDLVRVASASCRCV
ncbi:putative leader peptide [Streptomyces sp. NPDC019890]